MTINYNNLLQLAIEIAVKKHKGSVDKQDKVYVLHPLRVMLSFSDIRLQIIGVLHDVVEDTDVSFEQLSNIGFPNEIVEALKYLTRDRNIPYFTYIENVKKNDLAKQVKLADLKDNMRDGCPPNLLKRYKKAYKMLKEED